MHVSLYTLVLAEVEATTFRDFNYEKKRCEKFRALLRRRFFLYIKRNKRSTLNEELHLCKPQLKDVTRS